MDNFLFYAHSGLRWLVMLMTIVALVYLSVRVWRRLPFDKMTHRVVVIWSGLFGLQWIAGLLLFVVLGGFDLAHRWEHTVTMTIALAVAHAYVPLKRRADTVRYYGVLASIAIVLLLVIVGVARLPQGWTMSVDPPQETSHHLPLEDHQPFVRADFIVR